eukprot:6100105-Prymnesium_polylepis.1
MASFGQSLIRVGTLRAGLTLLEAVHYQKKTKKKGIEFRRSALIARWSVTVPNSHATSGTPTVDRRAGDAAAQSCSYRRRAPIRGGLVVYRETSPSGARRWRRQAGAAAPSTACSKGHI